MMTTAAKVYYHGGPNGGPHSNPEAVVETLQGELRSGAQADQRDAEQLRQKERTQEGLTEGDRATLSECLRIAGEKERQANAAPVFFRPQGRINDAMAQDWRQYIIAETKGGKGRTSELAMLLAESNGELNFPNIQQVIGKSPEKQQEGLDVAAGSFGNYNENDFPRVPSDDVEQPLVPPTIYGMPTAAVPSYEEVISGKARPVIIERHKWEEQATREEQNLRRIILPDTSLSSRAIFIQDMQLFTQELLGNPPSIPTAISAGEQLERGVMMASESLQRKNINPRKMQRDFQQYGKYSSTSSKNYGQKGTDPNCIPGHALSPINSDTASLKAFIKEGKEEFQNTASVSMEDFAGNVGCAIYASGWKKELSAIRKEVSSEKMLSEIDKKISAIRSNRQLSPSDRVEKVRKLKAERDSVPKKLKRIEYTQARLEYQEKKRANFSKKQLAERHEALFEILDDYNALRKKEYFTAEEASALYVRMEKIEDSGGFAPGSSDMALWQQIEQTELANQAGLHDVHNLLGQGVMPLEPENVDHKKMSERFKDANDRFDDAAIQYFRKVTPGTYFKLTRARMNLEALLFCSSYKDIQENIGRLGRLAVPLDESSEFSKAQRQDVLSEKSVNEYKKEMAAAEEMLFGLLSVPASKEAVTSKSSKKKGKKAASAVSSSGSSSQQKKLFADLSIEKLRDLLLPEVEKPQFQPGPLEYDSEAEEEIGEAPERISYSWHGEERIGERNIKKKQVRYVIDNPDPIYSGFFKPHAVNSPYLEEHKASCQQIKDKHLVVIHTAPDAQNRTHVITTFNDEYGVVSQSSGKS